MITGKGRQERNRQNEEFLYPERGQIFILLRSFGLFWNVFPKPPSSSPVFSVTYWMSYKFNSILTPVFPEVTSEPTGPGSLPQDCLHPRSQSRAQVSPVLQINMVIIRVPTPPPPVRSSPGILTKLRESISCHLPVCAKDMIKDTDEQVDEEARGEVCRVPSTAASILWELACIALLICEHAHQPRAHRPCSDSV